MWALYCGLTHQRVENKRNKEEFAPIINSLKTVLESFKHLLKNWVSLDIKLSESMTSYTDIVDQIETLLLNLRQKSDHFRSESDSNSSTSDYFRSLTFINMKRTHLYLPRTGIN